ncbi:SigB/SigF/SigG family RNA polymerase sigma factor [Nocardia sp. NPDC050175]|uniref:SigB/SigF/SigG family RNA polymerase sigma factor n=1 Tax=Nocardia sp. NPDC050175 TaxID=3364317 RepID=UPI00379616BA
MRTGSSLPTMPMSRPALDDDRNRTVASTDRAESASPARRSTRHSGRESYDNLEPLLGELAEYDAADPRRNALREDLIRRCLPLAEHIARKFAGRGESYDDLLQSASLGIVQAVDRFDPSHGSAFLAFAVPTLMGEVRHHFRDRTWAVRVPRRLKEIQQSLGPAIESLGQELCRPPTAREIAAHLDLDLVEVTHALIARNGYQSVPIDVTTSADPDDNPARSAIDSLGTDDPHYRTIEDYLTVQPLIEALPETDRRILILRFYEFKTQTQIADHLGVSQMQVSRILARILTSLHEEALSD